MNPQQDITYTPFNKTATITEGNYELTYTYGPDQQRRKSVLTNTATGNVEKTIIYAGAYEDVTVNGNTYKVHYIAGGSGLTAINVRHSGGDQMFYVYTDHLGSILKLTDALGNIVYEQNFDAWGRERNPNDWTYTPNPNTPPEWLIRGFTGHEMLKEFALVNMNGRMYDPVTVRVLSPDNYVLDPFSTQDYNRYTYALNNPMYFTDHTGQQTTPPQGAWDPPWRKKQNNGPNQYNSSYNIDYVSISGNSFATGIANTSIADLLYQEAYNKALYELYLEYNYVPLPKLNVATINTGAQFLESRLPEVIAEKEPPSSSIGFSKGVLPINKETRSLYGFNYPPGFIVEFDPSLKTTRGTNFDPTQRDKLVIYREFIPLGEREGVPKNPLEILQEGSKFQFNPHLEYFLYGYMDSYGTPGWKLGAFPIEHHDYPGDRLRWVR